CAPTRSRSAPSTPDGARRPKLACGGASSTNSAYSGGPNELGLAELARLLAAPLLAKSAPLSRRALLTFSGTVAKLNFPREGTHETESQEVRPQRAQHCAPPHSAPLSAGED